MQNALDGLLDALASVTENLSPLAKAVTAAVLPLAAALLNMAIAGSFDAVSVVVLATGAVSALAVYLVPNTRVAPVVAPVPAPPVPAPPVPVAPVPTAPVAPAPAAPVAPATTPQPPSK